MDILLYPDSGSEFLQALRPCVLYGRNVNVLTTGRGTALSDVFRLLPNADLKDAAGRAATLPTLFERVTRYFDFVESSDGDLQMLRQEGILRSFQFEKLGRAIEAVAPQILAHHEALLGSPQKPTVSWSVFQDALRWLPPSLSDLLAIRGALIAAKEDKIEATKSLLEEEGTPLDYLEVLNLASTEAYFVLLHHLVRRTGWVPVTWMERAQHVLWEVRGVFETSPLATLTARRSEVEGALAIELLREKLPSGQDLPFESLLEMKLRSRSEVEAFQTAVAALATEVDLGQPVASLRLNVKDLIASRVRPAVVALRASLASSRRGVFAKVARSTHSSVGAVIAAASAIAAGAPADLAAPSALVGAIAGAYLDGVVERKNALGSNPWALLLTLDRQARP